MATAFAEGVMGLVVAKLSPVDFVIKYLVKFKQITAPYISCTNVQMYLNYIFAS